ncbi:MAG: type II secretion system F family protein [Verrucomicrobia bacterium]|nr:type II secretion system F family protein [Verrucomicrobiota bacterium]
MSAWGTVPDFLISLMWAASGAAVAWYVGLTLVDITYVTLADGRRAERRLPLLYRLLLPFTPNFSGLVNRPVFARIREDLDRRLSAAGLEGLLGGRELLALRFLLPAVFGPLTFMLAHWGFAQIPGKVGLALAQRAVMFDAVFLLYWFVQPSLWLQSRVRDRHLQLQRALPFVLDLLTLSVEAGLDFMTAIKRIIDRRDIDALNEELIRVFREVQLGKTRREALRDMSDRVQQADIRSVTNALVQADELGVSIGAILRIQADQMRVRRFLNAEKMANEAPVKMLFPLIGFIFPAVFLILLGPIAVQVIERGF